MQMNFFDKNACLYTQTALYFQKTFMSLNIQTVQISGVIKSPPLLSSPCENTFLIFSKFLRLNSKNKKKNFTFGHEPPPPPDVVALAAAGVAGVERY